MRKWLGYALGVRTTIATAAVVRLVVAIMMTPITLPAVSRDPIVNNRRPFFAAKKMWIIGDEGGLSRRAMLSRSRRE
jgi:hypothetical protein